MGCDTRRLRQPISHHTRDGTRGRENVHKRYLIHVAGFNLGLLMRALFGAGAPRQASDAKNALLFAYQANETLVFAIVALVEGQWAFCLTVIAPEAD